MKRTLSNSDVKELNGKIEKYGFQFDKKDLVELEEGDVKVVKLKDEPLFFYSNGEILPTLKMALKGTSLKKITVDMGAVKFVVNGADIMRPGIVHIQDGIAKDEVIEIIDVNNTKPLAIGRALFSTGEMSALEKGKVIKNLHWIGDKIWKS